MADITLGQFYNAIAQGAREATLNALKGTDFATQQQRHVLKLGGGKQWWTASWS